MVRIKPYILIKNSQFFCDRKQAARYRVRMKTLRIGTMKNPLVITASGTNPELFLQDGFLFWIRLKSY
jgi:hypothetical protein